MLSASALSLSPSVSSSIASKVRTPTAELPDHVRKNVDQGWAWVVLTAAFLGLAICNGVCYTTGLYVIEFLGEYGESRAATMGVGSMLNSMACATGILASVISDKLSCRVAIVAGSLLSTAGLILSTFATSVAYLTISYGFITDYIRQNTGMLLIDLQKAFDMVSHPTLYDELCAVGLDQSAVCWVESYLERKQMVIVNDVQSEEGIVTCEIPHGYILGAGIGFVYSSVLVMTGLYFDKKRNFANGLVHTGGGFGLFVFSPLFEKLIAEYGWRGSMYIEAGICLNLVAVGLLMRPLPVECIYKFEVTEKESNKCIKCNPQTFKLARLLKSWKFCVFCFSQLALIISLAINYVCIGDYAATMGTTKERIPFIFSLIGMANLVGKLFFGSAANSPDLDSILVYFGTSAMVAVSSWIAPFLFQSYPGQLAYSILSGLYFSGPVVFLSALPAEFLPLDLLGFAIGAVLVIHGISHYIGPVLAGAIFDVTQSYANSFQFSAACSTIGAFSILLMPLSCSITKNEEICDRDNEEIGSNMISTNNITNCTSELEDAAPEMEDNTDNKQLLMLNGTNITCN